MVNDDPAPTVELIKRTTKIYASDRERALGPLAASAPPPARSG
jgi:hypothetical protein